MNIKHAKHLSAGLSHDRPPWQAVNCRGGHLRFLAGSLSRRQFVRTATNAAGLAVGASFLPSALAASCPDPAPIPGGQQFLFPDPTLFHILLPGYPFFPDNDPATNEPSVIGNFYGQVGLAYVQGNGTHTDLGTGEVSELPFEVDLRFMKGEYIGLDGRSHNGAFVLL